MEPLEDRLKALAQASETGQITLSDQELDEIIIDVTNHAFLKDAIAAKLVQCAYCGTFTERRNMTHHFAVCESRPEYVLRDALQELSDAIDVASKEIAVDHPLLAEQLRASLARARARFD
jgi:uncharacterized Fe-S cluster-containing MiaB family protein